MEHVSKFYNAIVHLHDKGRLVQQISGRLQIPFNPLMRQFCPLPIKYYLIYKFRWKLQEHLKNVIFFIKDKQIFKKILLLLKYTLNKFLRFY